jgi:uncharacterized SAM-dependent methyltransferase
MGNSFGYLDISGTRAFVSALADAVRPGGGLMIDVAAAAESILPAFNDQPRTMEAGGVTLTATNRYDCERGRVESTYRFVRGSEDVTKVALHHVFTVAQIGGLLTDAGFGEIAHFADTVGTPFTLGAGRLLLTCRR